MAVQSPGSSSASVRASSDGDGVVTVWLDRPGRSVNTLTPAVFTELDEIVQRAAESKPTGLIIASAKARSFVAGADLFELRAMNRPQLEAFLVTGQALFDCIANLGFPTIAAINGDCLGGGLELALACTHRISADDSSIQIGLPEVKLGLLPGWGGTVRLPRLIGLERALRLLLSGEALPPSEAKQEGFIDDLVERAALLPRAKQFLAGAKVPPVRGECAVADNPALFDEATSQCLLRGGTNHPAPLRLIEVVKAGVRNGPLAGLEAERKGLADLMETDAARNLMRLFFLRHSAKREPN